MRQKPEDSFSEQCDNALKCNQVFLETMGFKPASFTIPSDVYDGDTARALEAAGLEVGSETDASKCSKLWSLAAPHHPAGCSHFVELPRMHPRDPENACQLAMLKYWVGAARRTGRALVFLAHHHLLRYEGHESAHLVEELLRHVLADQAGDLYVGTLTAVGRYWRDVLSARTRCVQVSRELNRVTVTNFGPAGAGGVAFGHFAFRKREAHAPGVGAGLFIHRGGGWSMSETTPAATSPVLLLGADENECLPILANLHRPRGADHGRRPAPPEHGAVFALSFRPVDQSKPQRRTGGIHRLGGTNGERREVSGHARLRRDRHLAVGQCVQRLEPTRASRSWTFRGSTSAATNRRR